MTNSKKKLYVAMLLQKWENMQAHTPSPQPITGPDNSIGCLLVYDTITKLRKAHGRKAKHTTVQVISHH